MIVAAHLRRHGNDGATTALRMPWAPVSNYAVILFIVAVLALMVGNEHLRPATLLGLAWLAGLAAIYAVFIRGFGAARERA